MKKNPHPRQIRLTIGSRVEEIPLVGVAVKAVCSFLGLPGKMADEVELCTVEAVTNSVQHAYRHRRGDVEVELCLLGEKLVVEVWDTGESMTGESFRAGLLRSAEASILSADELPESGRGLQILFGIMDSCEYATLNGKNRLRMTRKLKSVEREQPFG